MKTIFQEITLIHILLMFNERRWDSPLAELKSSNQNSAIHEPEVVPHS